MKKLLLTFSLAIAATITFGQSINFGIKGGFNLSDQTGGMNDQYILKHQNTPGFNAGVIMNVDFNKFTLQPGLSYTTKGEKLPKQPSAFDPSYIIPITTYRLNYLEASFNGFYNIHLLPGAVFQLGGGPYFGQGISASYNMGGTKHSVTFGNDSNINGANYKNPDFGLNFIAGINLKKKIIIDFDYGLGLSDIGYYTTKMKNRVMSISVGYLFR